MIRQLKVRVAFGAVLAAYVLAAGLLLRAEPPQAVGTWASLGTTPESRVGAASVALPDGRTLIAGGSIAGAATDSVVVFDPADGSFASAGHLLLPRVGHTATLLDDGRVLIAGGTAGDLLSADLELFDPSSGDSVLGGAMAQPRTGHAAARLADGRVLIAGGTSTDGVLQSAEIYDPSTGATTPTTLPMLVARTGASATTLIDGRVLIAGGNSGTADLATAELFEASSQIFEAATTSMSVPRSGHAAVLLPWNNSVLITGGSSNGVAQTTSDLFLPAEFPDPFSYGMGSFAPTGSLVTARSGAVASPHIEGYAVAIGGGAPEAEVYRFATIKTDKDDYAPGTKAIITGSGWEPDADVTLVFQEDPAVHDDYILHVTSKSDGTIDWDQWAPEQHDLNVRFYLMAKQATPAGERRAQITFTDAADVTITPATGGSAISADTAGGTYTSLTGPILTENGSGAIGTGTIVLTAPSGFVFDTGGTAPTVKIVGDSTAGHNINNTANNGTIAVSVTSTTLTVTITSKSNAGAPNTLTWQNVRVRPTAATPLASGNILKSGTSSYSTVGGATNYGTLTEVPGAAATTTTVASSANPSTYGNSVTFTATVSSTSTPTGGVNFVIDSGSPVAGIAGTTTATTATWTYATVALNAGNHTVSASYVHSGSFQDSSGSLSGGQVVNKATPTATLAVNNSPQTYTGSGQAATVAISVSSVPGAVANILTGGAATQTTAATYAVTADFVPTDTTNYNSLIGLSAGNFVIQKATPVITWSDPADIIYGTALSGTQLNATADVAGGFVYTPPATTVLSAGNAQALMVAFTPTDTANYNNANKTVHINVQKATPVITWSDPADIIYGTALSGTQLNATADVAGGFVYTPPATTVLSAGNAQALMVAFTPTDTANYNNANKTVHINVQKATPVITWSDPADIIYGTALSGTQLNATADVAGGFVYTPPATTVLSAGNAQALMVAFTPTDTANYNNANKTVHINVQKATPVITWSDPADIIYGTALSGTQLNATADVAGGFVYTPPATTVLSAGNAQALMVAFTPTDTANYNNANKTVHINVQKATPVITWSDPADIIYGTALSGTQLNATADVAGGFVYTPPATTVLSAGNAQALMVAFTPTDTANYNNANKTVHINVQKATPVITWSDPADIIYGTALSGTQLNATADVAGGFVYTPPATTVLSAGNAQALMVAFTPTDTANYNNANKTVHINVQKATPVITWSDPADIIYGTALSGTQLNATADVAGGFVYTPPATTVLSAGNAQALMVAFTPTDTANYNNANKTVHINVQKATPVITWSDPADIIYGTALSGTQLNATADVAGGFVYTPPATTVLSAGNAQALMVAFTPTDTANYNNANKTVHINVQKATPVITWSDPADIIYGTALSGTQLNATADVAGGFVYTPPATTVLSAGNAQALMVAFTPTDTANYNNANKTVHINVQKATPVITWSDPADIIYGTALSGTQLNATADVAGGFVYTPPATTVLSAGNAQALMVAFTPTDTANYNNANKTVHINVQKATPTATLAVNNSPQTYTGSGQAATVAISVSSVPGAVANILTGGAATQTNAATYAVTADFVPTDTTNYNSLIGVAAGNFVIQKATPSATLAVNNSPQTYTGAGQAATVVVSVSSVPGTVANILTGGAATQTTAATYAVTANFVPTDTTNYNTLIGLAAGNFVIAKATATVVVVPYNVQWDGSPHTATYTITGVNGETGATVGAVTLNTTHTNAGTYSTDSWSFTPTGNYNPVAGATITDVIGTAYCFNGFLSPIGGSVETSNGGSFLNPVKAFKLGSTIPIKFILNSLNGSTCGAVVTTGIHTLQAIYYSSAVDSDWPIDASPTDAATTDNQFRLTSPEWHFNLSTKGAGFKAGTWLLQATLSDGSVHTVWITIKK